MAHGNTDLTRSEALGRLLARTGFADASRVALAGDASTRRYERLTAGAQRAVLMDAPPSEESPPCPPEASPEQRRALGWNAQSRLAACRVDAFAAIGTYLSGLGLSAPRIYGADYVAGYAVLEDLGDGLFARAIPDGADEASLYRAAAQLLAHVHSAPAPMLVEGAGARWPLLEYDALALEVNANLFVEWAPRAVEMRIDDAELARWEQVRADLVDMIGAQPRAFVIRDYHAENLLWLPERAGLAQVGLLDFQDALRGPRAWDMAMLLDDARRDVGEEARRAALRAYFDASGANEEDFARELACVGALNAMRILGLFARLAGRDGKTRYLAYMPREWRHLARNLAHPALADMRSFVTSIAGAYLEAGR